MLLPGATAVPRGTFRAIFDDVEAGLLRRGVVPLENSQAGSINDTYNLLAGSQLIIVGEVIVRVDKALLGLPGARPDRIRRVLSHPQALAQCQEYLAKLDAEVIAVYDTVGAAKQVAQHGREDEAAVASEHAAAVYGQEVLAPTGG
jgi:prephenate dehydratase